MHFEPEVQDMPSYDQQVAAERDADIEQPQPSDQPLPNSDNDIEEPPVNTEPNTVAARSRQREQRQSAARPDAPPRPQPAVNSLPDVQLHLEQHAVPNHLAFITDDRERWPELHNLGSIDQPGMHCKGCGAAHWLEERRKKQSKRRDKQVSFYSCCRDNTVRLEPISDPFPEELKALFTGEGHTFHNEPVTPGLRETFCNNTRAINNALAFACITNTNQEKRINNGSAPWVYKIHGQMYRQISPAQARDEHSAALYSQLYFYDPETANQSYESRFANDATLASLVTNTHAWLREHNPYAHTYQILRDVLETVLGSDEELPLYSIVFNNDKALDQRVYNKPTINTEVAAIIAGDRSRYDREQSLTVLSRSVNRDCFETLNCTCPQADPLCYTLFNPRGGLGFFEKMPSWTGDRPEPDPQPVRSTAQRQRNMSFIDNEAADNDSPVTSSSSSSAESEQGEYGQAIPRRRKKQKKWAPRKKLTMLDYFAYRMHWRKEGVHQNNQFSPLFFARRLFQQYAVDSFNRVEEHELNWHRTDKGQKKLRAEAYSRLNEYITDQARDRNLKPGKPIVLPSTFAGSSRHMAQEYMDAMAITRKKGKNGIDYFVTMTCNPKWEEVVSSLPRDANGNLLQTAADRPDIVARVFKMKLDELLKDLFEKKIFGEIGGYAWTIEYQVH
jgi:hypothetical protein